MPYVCLNCWEVYWSEQHRCPKRSCGDSPVVEIDELMLPIIRILNEKRYWTRNCCSGHTYDECCNPYIQFDELLREEILEDSEVREIFKDLPSGWELEIDNESYVFCLRNHIKKKDVVSMYEEIVNANLTLLKYVDKLPLWDY